MLQSFNDVRIFLMQCFAGRDICLSWPWTPRSSSILVALQRRWITIHNLQDLNQFFSLRWWALPVIFYAILVHRRRRLPAQVKPHWIISVQVRVLWIANIPQVRILWIANIPSFLYPASDKSCCVGPMKSFTQEKLHELYNPSEGVGSGPEFLRIVWMIQPWV